MGRRRRPRRGGLDDHTAHMTISRGIRELVERDGMPVSLVSPARDAQGRMATQIEWVATRAPSLQELSGDVSPVKVERRVLVLVSWSGGVSIELRAAARSQTIDATRNFPNRVRLAVAWLLGERDDVEEGGEL